MPWKRLNLTRGTVRAESPQWVTIRVTVLPDPVIIHNWTKWPMPSGYARSVGVLRHVTTPARSLSVYQVACNKPKRKADRTFVVPCIPTWSFSLCGVSPNHWTCASTAQQADSIRPGWQVGESPGKSPISAARRLSWALLDEANCLRDKPVTRELNPFLSTRAYGRSMVWSVTPVLRNRRWVTRFKGALLVRPCTSSYSEGLYEPFWIEHRNKCHSLCNQ